LVAPRVSTSAVARSIALAVFVIFAAGWAVARHFMIEPAPMLRPAPTSAPTYDIEAGELPVPETFEPDAS
jgi:hypothetical protein